MGHRTAGELFEPATDDADHLRQRTGGGAAQLSGDPECCTVATCSTSHRGPCTVRARDPGRGPSSDQAHDTGDECGSG
ncbi:hypothetical protein GCM10009789_60670 [Kribbella sancticallisti]|uniref:Uncharacterized protein n=1 Tax=Kribbella sancticallisti TaxID=460087 RepID=A0ABN2E904_9ACTN